MEGLFCEEKTVHVCWWHILCHSQTFNYSYSVLPALSLDIISVSIVQGSNNYDSFGEFIDGLLDQMSPFPNQNSVIIMDDCRIHKCKEDLERIIER